MTDTEFAKFIDEIVSLRDRFDKAAKNIPKGLAPHVQLVSFRLAQLEAQVARPSLAELPLKGRKPNRHRPRPR